MDLKLTEHVRNTIFLLYKQNTGWNSNICNIFSKKLILANISLKIYIFRSAMFCYVIVTSYVDWFSWFWYQWKEETLPYTMVPNNFTLHMSISSSQGDGNHLPQEDVLQKRLRKTTVNVLSAKLVLGLTNLNISVITYHITFIIFSFGNYMQWSIIIETEQRNNK